MKDLRSEVRQLCGFCERELIHEAGVLDDTRVGAEHPVHIGPDLNLRRLDARTDKGTGVVRAAATERRSMAADGCANKSPQHRNAASVEKGPDSCLESCVRLLTERRRPCVLIVGDDYLPGIDPLCRNTRARQRSSDDARREELADSRRHVERANGYLTQHGQSPDDIGELIELSVNLREQLFQRGSAHKITRRDDVPPANVARPGQRLIQVRGTSRRGHAEEAVRDAAHRRHDDRRTASITRPRRPDDLDQASDSC
jgi:hypothetical protein